MSTVNSYYEGPRPDNVRDRSRITNLRVATVVSRAGRILVGLFRASVIIGVSYVILEPVLTMLSQAFMAPQDLYDTTVIWIPKNFTMRNFIPVVKVMDYLSTFSRSLLLSLLTAIMQVVSCTMIGYGFARFRFPGKNLLFSLVVLTLVIPPQTVMIPLFLHFRFFDILGVSHLITGGSLNLLDSYWPFLLQAITGNGIKNGLYILIFRQFFMGMSKEIEEAAYVDGAGTFRTFFQMMVPNATPAIVTVFLFSFVWQWNDEFYASLFVQGSSLLPQALQTMALNIETLAGPNVKLDPYYMSLLNNTGALLVIAPPLLLYLITQRYFVESIERTGLVG